MALLEILQLIGYSTATALHFWIAALLGRSRRDLNRLERVLLVLAIALGVWHASSLLVVLHSMLGLSQGRWTPLLRFSDTLAVTSVTLTYSLLLHLHLHLWADARGRGLTWSERARVYLSYELAGIEALERPLLVLRRLRALAISGRFRPSLHARICRAHRLVQLLRTHDALQAGAGQVDIAQLLLRHNLERSRWRIHSPSIRSQAQRLVAAAGQMSAGGFWRLLE